MRSSRFARDKWRSPLRDRRGLDTARQPYAADSSYRASHFSSTTPHVSGESSGTLVEYARCTVRTQQSQRALHHDSKTRDVADYVTLLNADTTSDVDKASGEPSGMADLVLCILCNDGSRRIVRHQECSLHDVAAGPYGSSMCSLWARRRIHEHEHMQMMNALPRYIGIHLAENQNGGDK
ncbi:hypothetical protein E4U55_006921 [Claviceps digitariae]|nr:hypothetical protein E4U55_006921 [Claviceps digitariae]